MILEWLSFRNEYYSRVKFVLHFTWNNRWAPGSARSGYKDDASFRGLPVSLWRIDFLWRNRCWTWKENSATNFRSHGLLETSFFDRLDWNSNADGPPPPFTLYGALPVWVIGARLQRKRRKKRFSSYFRSESNFREEMFIVDRETPFLRLGAFFSRLS